MTTYEATLKEYAVMLIDMLGPEKALQFARERRMFGVIGMIEIINRKI